MSSVQIDTSSLQKFLKKFDGKKKQLKTDVSQWIEAQGFQFLEEVQREIIRLGVVDTRRMLNSFTKGQDGSIWRISDGGLTLEVGTNVEYAKAQNDGWEQSRRWVPGRWIGERFIYEPGSSTGMLLREKRIEGKPYWDNAVLIFERMFGESLKRKLEAWVAEMEGDY